VPFLRSETLASEKVSVVGIRIAVLRNVGLYGTGQFMTTPDQTSRRTKRSRNPAEYPVMGMLLGGPLHGYDICRRLGEGIGSIWKLGKSQIYALLAKLEREGLVIHERVGQDNLPAKNIFSLTPEGIQVVKEWLEQPVNHFRDMRLEFVTKLWFIRQAFPEPERLLIEKQLGVCGEKVTVLEGLKDSCGNQVEALSIDFRVTVIRATVSWLECLLDSIQTGNSKEKRGKGV